MTDVELQVSRLIVESAGSIFPEKGSLVLIVYLIGVPIVARLVWHYNPNKMGREDCIFFALLWPLLLLAIPGVVAAVAVLGVKFLAWLLLPAEEDRP